MQFRILRKCIWYFKLRQNKSVIQLFSLQKIKIKKSLSKNLNTTYFLGKVYYASKSGLPDQFLKKTTYLVKMAI